MNTKISFIHHTCTYQIRYKKAKINTHLSSRKVNLVVTIYLEDIKNIDLLSAVT